MSKRSKNDGYVYSTNPDFEYQDEDNQESVDPNQQTLEVHIDRKQRGGKVATLVKGFIGPDDELKDLGKTLKSACGVGGSAKNGEIIIQGEKRDKVMEVLKKKGFKVKRVGG
ncbi:MAG: translation initiation factor [Flavobacteriales bacterium]|nr:translation initiation factor [Flavobacteriales bacterium]|tara:strand:+ start:109 stop:444 length:336 start_codon:yes stop_codon:yes gene_type:complete